MIRERRRVGCLVVVMAAAFAVAPARADVSRPLFQIPVDQVRAMGGSIDAGRPLRLALESADPVALQRLLAGRASGLDAAGRVEVVLGPYVAAPVLARRDWLAATFLIDYQDQPVPELVKQLLEVTPDPKLSDVIAFVAKSVSGSHDRGIDVASQVARNRDGDCTEYAVLTAALARATGLPARVVVGLAVMIMDSQVVAYGHAWAEIDSGAGWQVADAALFSETTPVRYLPLGVIDDEGPGYAMGFAALMPTWVRRVVVLPDQQPG